MKLEIKAGQYDLLMETSAASLQKMSNPLDRWVYTIVSFFTDGETKSLSDLTSTVQQVHCSAGNRTWFSYSQATS